MAAAMPRPQPSLCARGCHTGLGTRGPRGSPGARCPAEGTPTWRPHTAAKLTERIRYKTLNTAPVRVMPGIPDPSLPSPFGGGTGGKASREGCTALAGLTVHLMG